MKFMDDKTAYHMTTKYMSTNFQDVPKEMAMSLVKIHCF